MKCPYCEQKIPERTTICPHCGETIDLQQNARPRTWRDEHRWLVSFISMFAAIALCFAAGTMIYNFVKDYQIKRAYTRGELTPQVSEVTLSDGRPAHAVLFYGENGDSIFIPELNSTYPIADGITRVSVADGTWFDDGTIEQVDNAIVTLSPVLMKKGGETIELPQITMEIVPPQSPLTVTSPAEETTTVYTTLMPLTFHVVPGSTVLINGTDASDQVDRNGDITYNVNVYAIGDNTYSILVKTDNHRETRKDVVYHRAEMDIEISLSSSTASTSSSSTLKVTGTTEPDSIIVVDSDYVEGSVVVDHETGEFSFIASFDTIGMNTVRFHAEREGSQNSTISFQVKYVPALNEYSRKAWKMDYSGLCQLYEQWTGRVFLCQGYVTDVFYEDDTQFVVMNVATDGSEQLVILQNESSIGLPDKVTEYAAYADVTGRKYHNSAYYPLLVARYMDEAKQD